MENLFRGLPDPSQPAFQELVSFSEKNARKVLPHLPIFTSLVASDVSFRDAYRISYEHSGRRLYLPKDKSAFEQKVECQLSEVTYDKILKIACAEPQIEVPSSWGVFIVIRKVVIIDYLEQNQSKLKAQIEFGANRRFIDKLWRDQNIVG